MATLPPILRRIPLRGKTSAWKYFYKRFPYRETYTAAFPEGFSMVLHPEDLWEFLMLAGTYERREKWLLEQILRPGDIFIDGGANLGYFSCLAGCLVQDGQVYAFEPHPETVKSLRQNLRLNPELPIHLQESALSETSGTGALSLLEHKDGFHPNQASLIQHRGTKIQTVATTSLDDFIAAHHIPHVTLTKLDLEGAEPGALRGARQSLEKGLLESLLIEVTAETCRGIADALKTIPFEHIVNLRTWEEARDITALKNYLPQPNLLFLRGQAAARYRTIAAWKKGLI